METVERRGSPNQVKGSRACSGGTTPAISAGARLTVDASIVDACRRAAMTQSPQSPAIATEATGAERCETLNVFLRGERHVLTPGVDETIVETVFQADTTAGLLPVGQLCDLPGADHAGQRADAPQ